MSSETRSKLIRYFVTALGKAYQAIDKRLPAVTEKYGKVRICGSGKIIRVARSCRV
jgi:hypothetical protein